MMLFCVWGVKASDGLGWIAGRDDENKTRLGPSVFTSSPNLAGSLG